LATALCERCGEAVGMEHARVADQFAGQIPAEGLLCAGCWEQVPEFARAVSKRLRVLRPAWRLRAGHDALRRVKSTRSQFTLTAKGRTRNMRGAFAVADEAAVMGREVLLVDDIYTTGATVRECARVLLRSGASRVWVATLARAQKEAVALWGEFG
jgi:predicted amidophosphoribosyltransferase